MLGTSLLAFVLSASITAAPDEPAIYSGAIENAASVAFSPDGHWLATGGINGKIALWAADSCDGTIDLGSHDGEVRALAFSPDGKQLASGEEYKKLKLWNVGPGVTDGGDPKRHEAMTRKLDGAVLALAFAPDGKTLFVGSRDNVLLEFDPSGADAAPRALAHEYEVLGLAVAPDGTMLASGDGGGNVRLWSLAGDPPAQPEELRSLKRGAPVTALAFGADGKTLFAATAEPALIAVDVATGKALDGFAATGVEANALAFVPARKALVAGTQDNLVVVIDSATGKVTKKLEGHEGPVTSVAVSPDGRVVASASRDRTVRVWLLDS